MHRINITSGIISCLLLALFACTTALASNTNRDASIQQGQSPEGLTQLEWETIQQRAYLKASNTEADDRFGVSLAISGDTLVVGAWMEDSNATGTNGDGSNDLASESGAVYVFASDLIFSDGFEGGL